LNLHISEFHEVL